MAALSLAGFAAPADAAFIVISVTGKTQGVFKAESTSKPFAGKTEVLSYQHAMHQPIDLGSGLPNGRMVLAPIEIEKNAGISTPQWLSALRSGELPTVTIDFWMQRPDGMLVLYQTVKLTNARVTNVRHVTDGSQAKEHISLAYETYELTRDGLKTSLNWAV